MNKNAIQKQRLAPGGALTKSLVLALALSLAACSNDDDDDDDGGNNPPAGACSIGATCIVTDAVDCAAMGGVYQGDGSSCPTGACYIGANCIVTDPVDCAVMGGVYQGDGSSCNAAQAETEPNDSAATANALEIGRPVHGEVLIAGDIDFWSFELDEDDIVDVRLTAVALDQATWSAGPNSPSLTIWDTDGVTALRSQDLAQFAFFIGNDLDFVNFRAPADGTYYVSITQYDPLLAGGSYSFVVENVNLGTLQVEAEGQGVSGLNDSPATAEPITPGVLRGYHVDGEQDWFEFMAPGPGFARFEISADRNGIYVASGEYSDLLLSLNTNAPAILQDNDDVALFDPILAHQLGVAGPYLIAVIESFSGDTEYFLSYDWVDTADALTETELNDTSAAANAMSYGDYMTGSTDVGDPDFFAFSGTAGDVVLIKPFFVGFSEVASTGITLDLLGPDGVTPLSYAYQATDFPLLRTILQETGTHYISVGPDAVAPGPTDYAFELESSSQNTYEVEPNNTIAVANTLTGDAAAGVVDPAGDFDVFSFQADAEEAVRFDIFASNDSASTGYDKLDGYGSDLDPLVIIRDSMGVQLAVSLVPANPLVDPTPKNVSSGIATVAVGFIAPADGTYYLEVTDQTVTGSSDHTYVVRRH